MFYLEKKEQWYFIWNDESKGKFWPFLSVFCKNILYWENIFWVDLQKYPWYKYSLGFSKNRVFILDEKSQIEFLNFKK